MSSSINGTLISYMASQGLVNSSNLSSLLSGSSSTANSALSALLGTAAGTDTSSTTTTSSSSSTDDETITDASLQLAAKMYKSATAIQNLDNSQKSLGEDLRAAMTKAGVTLSGDVQFTIGSDNSVEVTGTGADADADVAAVQAFLKADTSDPSFATRIADQAQTAVTLSDTIQQNAAISQAAQSLQGNAAAAGSVLSLYKSLMQQQPTTKVVFTLSTKSSSLTYPGSLTAKA